MSGILMIHRGTSSPEPPCTRPALARGRIASRALSPNKIWPVVQARDPEHEPDQEEESEHGHRDDLRREAKGWRKRVHRGVPNDTVDMPVLAEPGANVAHQPHEPREGDRDEDQHVLRDRRNLPPAYLAGPPRPT